MENETPSPDDDSQEEAVEEAAAATDGASENASAEAPDYAPEELDSSENIAQGAPADVNLNLVLDVPVSVSLRVGSTDISIRDLVTLVEGSVVALDQDAGESMDVLVNGTLIAHGEIVVVDDQYGVRLTDVVSPTERIEQLQ